jgi:eukaryotic-like serine/threonine-protein kinase
MSMDQPLVGRTIGGRFKIVSHIGEGAMASVFRGVDTSRQSADVAIKVMHPHLAQDRTFSARFKREAQAASMIKHPNSVAIYDLGEEQGIHFIVMELCPGRDLRETLRVDKRLAEPRAVRIVATICDALHAAHQLGVIHRDLKPENVMVLFDPATKRDAVKVLDFGIAKLVDAQPKVRVGSSPDSEPPPALTQFGVVVGTPAYMSPEQCRGQPLDGRSDLYTCGILLYQLVTGQVPFDSPSPLETAGKQAFEQPPAPSSILPSIDRELEGIILKTLAKNPAERPQTALELKETLLSWLDKRGEIDRAAGSNVDLRALGKTMPMKAMAASVEDYLRQKGIGGPFMPQGAQGQAQGQAPMAPPAGAHPLSGTQITGETPPGGTSRGPLGTNIPIEPAQPAGPAPAPGQGPSGLYVLEGGPQLAQPGAFPGPAEPFAPASEKRSGWGFLGLLLILISLGAGIAIGLTLYRYVPLP